MPLLDEKFIRLNDSESNSDSESSSDSNSDPRTRKVSGDMEFIEIFYGTITVIKNTESQYRIEDLQDKDWNRENHEVFLRNIRGIMGKNFLPFTKQNITAIFV